MNSCSSPIGRTDHLQVRYHLTAAVFLEVDLTILVDMHIQLGGQGIYNGRTHSVQSSRNLVATTAKFTTGVKNSKDSLYRWTTSFFLDVDRDTTAIIHHCDGIILFDIDLDMLGKTSQGLINGVVYNLPDQVMQAFFSGRSDIHPWTQANRLQAF